MTLARRLGSLLVSGVFASGLMLAQTPAPVAAASCQPTNQATYSVTVCITAPTAGANVHGDALTTATVSFTGTSPGVRRVEFELNGSYLLTDFTPPYTFKLPTTLWQDGVYTLSAVALLRDGVTSTAASISLSFNNGIKKPPQAPKDFQAKSTSASHPVIAAAGDGPDGSPPADSVASLIQSWAPDLALYLGDVYENGSPAEMYNWYGLTGWGALGSITNPVVGNHEYTAGQAPGYFDYWHNPPHYYAFTAGSWHIIALDSTSQYNQTAIGTAQYNWLQNQLNSYPTGCTLVYFHHPVYSVGPQGNTAAMQDMWKLMVDKGVDVVLTGHDHSYQRWAPLDRNGNASAAGVTQFVVGTAGHGIQAFVRTDPNLVVGYDTSPAAFGALKLTLNPSGAGYVFADTSDVARDGGALQCSGTPVDSTPPSQINDLAATAPLGGYVNLTWTASLDDVGISEYRILRNGAQLATTYSTHFKDTEVVPGATYTYQVVAVDPAGHTTPSNTSSATTPSDGGLIFVDDFESGNLSQWMTTGAFTVDTTAPFAGAYDAHEVTTGTAAYAYHDFSSAHTDLYYRVRFKILNQDTTLSDYLMRVRTSTTQSLIGISVSNTGKLNYRNDTPGGTNHSSSVTVTPNAWHEVQVHVKVAGSSGSVAVWYDGAPVPELTNVEDMGTVGVSRLQIGDNASSRTHEVLFDDVAASTGYVDDTPPPPPDTTPPSAPGTLTADATGPNNVNLAWGAATDDTAVTGYDIYRSDSSDAAEGPVYLDSVDGATTTYADVVAPETTYGYTVRASDAAGNVGPASNTATVTTPPLPTSGTFTFDVAADSYIDDSKPTVNRGTATDLYIDASPQQISYLRFDMSGMGGMATDVKLRLYANANGKAGCDVLPVADSSWGETTITWNNAPPRGTSIATCAGFSAGSWVEVNLPPSLVTGNGSLSLAISNPSSTATKFSSREGGTPAQLVVTTSAPDTQAPSAPGTLTATAAGTSTINLSWGAATDDTGVVAYDISRDGSPLTSVSGSTLAYQDTGLSAATTYGYSVVARDLGGNTGPPVTASATTDTAPTSGTWTVQTTADSYVDASKASNNYGTATSLRIDASPLQVSYLRFDLSNVVGSVSSAMLRLYAQARGSSGCEIHPVADNNWTEAGITYSNAPTRGATVATCASFNSGSWVEVDLTNAGVVSGGGLLTLAITDPSSTATRFSSREGGNAAELVVVTVPPDNTPPTAPSGLTATAQDSNTVDLAWTPATDNVGVASYDIIRDGSTVTSVDGAADTYQDTGLDANTAYAYEVQAVDGDGNVSDPSNTATVTTDPAPTSGTWTFDVVADTYVDASNPTSPYGLGSSLRIDASPEQYAYLRFDLTGVVGTVSSLTLRIYAEARGSRGCDVLSVADNAWDEATVTWDTAPTRGPTVASCGSFSPNSWVEVSLPTTLVTGDGSLSLAIADPSSTATRFSSREGTYAAQLVVVTVPGP